MSLSLKNWREEKYYFISELLDGAVTFRFFNISEACFVTNGIKPGEDV